MDISNALPKTRSLNWYHWIVVALSALLTFGAWYISSQQVRQKMEIQFDYQASQIVELVKERMAKYEYALWSGVASIHANGGDISVSQWRTFSESLSIEDKYPGINGIGVIYYVPEDKLLEHLTEQRFFRSDYGIHPIHNVGEYWPITYIEPVEINAPAVGLDMAHENNRYTAAKKSRDTGTAQITGPIVLVQDQQKTPGFLFYVPFYNNNTIPDTLEERQKDFVGLVYAPFIMNKLMDGTLENKKRLVNFALHDDKNTLYDELNNKSEDYDLSPLFSKHIEIDLYGRKWVFDIQTSTLFKSQYSSNQPIIILIGGLIIDSLLFLLFVVLVVSNKRAVTYAKEVTEHLRESEIKLENSYKRLSSTFDTMMDSLVVINATGTIVEVNSSLLSTFGYKRDEVIGNKVDMLMPHSIAIEHKHYLSNYFMTKNKKVIGKRRVFAAINKDGKEFPVELNVTEMNVSGETFFTGVIHNLSDKVEVERTAAEKSALLTAAVMSSPAGFAILNAAGFIVEVNDSLAEWLGGNKDLMLGRRLYEFVIESDKTFAREEIERLKDNEIGTIRNECQFQHHNGHALWGVVNISPVKDIDGQVQFMVCQIMDINETKKLMFLSEERNLELEKSNKELDQFAYIASHDLKSPLNAISKLSSWIEEDSYSIIPDSSKKYFDMLRGRVSRMNKLLEDLLEYSRVGRVEYDFSVSKLESVVNDVAELMDVPDRFKIEIEPATFVAPPIPLHQVLRNLIGNSIKHHHQKGGVIKVSAVVQKNRFVLAVKDDGPGIPKAMHVKSVEMFQTLKPRDEVEGSGMGLALCKKIAMSYGGDLWIESDGSSGTTIFTSWFVNQDEKGNRDKKAG